jgi:hypothetical protein
MGSQLLPFGDKALVETNTQFEKAAYAEFVKGR